MHHSHCRRSASFGGALTAAQRTPAHPPRRYRALITLVSLVITSIALAVPLPPTCIRPLIDIFISDRVNVGVLTFFVVCRPRHLGDARDLGSGTAARLGRPLSAGIAVGPFETMMLGWAMVIPYFLYVLRCSIPATSSRACRRR